ncbi:hypothetical protein ABBQ38_013561 [Trebouxia sp. C0009 RCD-2024]
MQVTRRNIGQPGALSKDQTKGRQWRRYTVCRADMRVVAIPGALRSGSTNNGLLRAAAEVLPSGMHMIQADYSQLPLYNDDMWTTGIPDSVKTFRNHIESADALLFAVPEYNYSLPGPLKNAIDWASKNPNVFAGKPATMLGSGGGAGTATAQLHLRQAAAWLDIHFLNKPTIQIHRFTEQEVFDDDGNLISEKWRGRVQQQMLALQQWTELFQK